MGAHFQNYLYTIKSVPFSSVQLCTAERSSVRPLRQLLRPLVSALSRLYGSTTMNDVAGCSTRGFGVECGFLPEH
eukprot:5162172-Prymnesium_polylepis.1